MRGAVAAGHPLTAQAGADVLAAGGNAVDAAVGAALVSWVAESPLTGPGSGGFMLVHRARDRSTRVYDFFVAVPGLGLDNRDLSDMDRVDVDFSGGSTQVFHIGAASCAVPGAALGLEEAHRSFGSLPWRDLFQPAIELARNGVELNKGQAYLHAILDLILRHTPESREVYERNGERLVAEDTLIQKDLAATLELIAEQGGTRPLRRRPRRRDLRAHPRQRRLHHEARPPGVSSHPPPPGHARASAARSSSPTRRRRRADC